jgi:hypothetical protein
MLRVGQVDVADMVNDFPIDLLGNALVETAISRLHVKEGDFAPLGRIGRKATVGVSEEQKSIGLRGGEYFIRFRNHVPDGLRRRLAGCI